MSGDFLDSNVFLYSVGVDERKKSLAQGAIQRGLKGEACISFQVVQEVLNRLTRGPEPMASEVDAEIMLNDFLVPLWRVMPSQRLYEHALRLKSRYHYSFYDSLIIAAALEAGCTRLLSEDMQDGQRIEGLTISNPFASLNGANGR